MSLELTTVSSAAERKAAKRREAIKKSQAASGMIKGSSFEPTIAPLSYKIDLIKALNYYNTTYDERDKSKWTIEYVTDKTQKKFLSLLPDYEFHSIGSLVRLKHRNQYLDDQELTKIDNEINRLVELAKSLKVAEPTEPTKQQTVNVHEHVLTEAEKIAAEFDGLIDEFIHENKVPNFAEYLKNNNVSARVSSKVPELFSLAIEEITLALSGDDKELSEGYNNFTKYRLKKLLTIYQSITEACNQHKIIAKVTYKPRKKKEKPVSKIISKLKFQKDDESLGIKSELPSKLIGASEVWLYNTKYKILQVYKVSEPSKMSVKGTTLIGWDTKLSNGKRIRKPEMLSMILSMGKRDMMKSFRDIKTNELAVTGRINQNTLILKVFS